MEFTVSFDPLHFLGLVVCGYLASLAGNVLATIIVGIFTPSLDGQRFYKIAGLLVAMGAMTIPKVIVALIAAAVTLAVCATTGNAMLWTMAATAVVGFLFTLIAGSSMRI